MRQLNEHRVEMLEGEITDLHSESGPKGRPASTMILGVVRRWYIVLPTFVLICLVGIPAIWMLKKPVYTVAGAIRVAPVVTNVFTGETKEGEIGRIETFMQTQAMLITSGPVVERVADDLVDKKLQYFESASSNAFLRYLEKLDDSHARPNPASILRQAISDEKIRATAESNSELITVSMDGVNPAETRQIVDAFILAYMAAEGRHLNDGDIEKLAVLEEEKKVLLNEMDGLRKSISELANEYGDKDLTQRRDMKMNRVATLLAKVTEYETRRIHLEATVEILRKGGQSAPEIGPEEIVKMRNDFIKADPVVQAFAENVTLMEQEIIAARQTMKPENPELQRRQGVLEELRARMVQLREEAGREFDKFIGEKIARNSQQGLREAEAELEQVKMYEQRFRELLSKEDTEVVGVGRKQIAIQDLQAQLELTRDTYEIVSRRIKELQMDRKRPVARVDVAYSADIAAVADRRMKLTVALIFAALGAGLGLAFLRARADERLHTAEDLANALGINVLGTTTSSRQAKASLLPGQLAEDYQTISVNLEFMGSNGSGRPKMLVVGSPGPREGKTTFAINLATSLAESGARVLLIDGDLRKSDVAHMLNIPVGSRRLEDLILGRDLDQCVYQFNGMRLEVLATDPCKGSQAIELLTTLQKIARMENIAREYDHIIIDTPPILAFPDATIWAKMAGSVILTSFAGQTTAPALKEVEKRLSRMGITIVGTVLNNVTPGRGYYQYGYSYGYYAREGNRPSTRNRTKALLMSIHKPVGESGTDEGVQSARAGSDRF